MAFDFVNDTIRGNMATLTAHIYNPAKLITEPHEIEALKFSVNITIVDVARAVLNKMTKQHKTGLMDLSGSMDIYTNDPIFIQALKNYKNTKRQPAMSMTCVNNDVGSSAKKKTVKVIGIQFTSIPLTSLDVNADLLQETLSFVANDFEII